MEKVKNLYRICEVTGFRVPNTKIKPEWHILDDRGFSVFVSQDWNKVVVKAQTVPSHYRIVKV